MPAVLSTRSPLKILFAGTPDFAVPCLQALHHSPHRVCAVLTQPDKPAGRGRVASPSAIKQYAQQAGLPLMQLPSLDNAAVLAQLAKEQPDWMIVVAYGLKLPVSCLSLPEHGCINVHASLLPRWRGASPIQHALLAGDTHTGITLMQMDHGIDTGPILSQYPCQIADTDNATTLLKRLAAQGATHLLDYLTKSHANDHITAQPQPNNGITLAKKIRKDDACIHWHNNAQHIAQAVKAFHGWPVAHTYLDRQSPALRIWSAYPLAQSPTIEGEKAATGTIYALSPQGIDVTTGDGLLRITQLQAAGGKALPAHAFLRGKGRMLQVGQRFFSPPKRSYIDHV